MLLHRLAHLYFFTQKIHIFDKVIEVKFFVFNTFITCLTLSTILWAPKTIGASSSLDRPIVVAVIDTGADLLHEELKDHLWINPSESESSNGKDTDNNGYVDDFHGWDFSNAQANIKDTNGHGTHVAGLIKKAFLEEVQAGAQLQLMILKYTSQNGKNSKASFLKALKYAIDNGADIINISASGKGFSKKEFELLKIAYEKGIQIVVATGNKKPGTPDANTFPASYNLPNIHPVAATNSRGEILPSSNMIKKPRVLFALGKDLNSSLPGNTYGKKTGTSQATALISGRLAASLFNRFARTDVPTHEHELVMNP